MLLWILAALRNNSHAIAAANRDALFGDALGTPISEGTAEWLTRNAFAIVNWGATTRFRHFAQNIALISLIALIITAFRHSWWWLCEYILITIMMSPVHRGYSPLKYLRQNAGAWAHPDALSAECGIATG